VTLTLRDANPKDLSEMAKIESTGAGWSFSQLDATLGSPHSFATLALVGGVAVAHVVATAVTDEGEVLTLGVHPRWRRRGVGRILVGSVLHEWRKRNIVRGFLEVRADNQPAIRLYSGLSWRPVGRRAGYYPDGTDAIVMTTEVK